MVVSLYMGSIWPFNLKILNMGTPPKRRQLIVGNPNMRLFALPLNGLTAAWQRHSMTHFLGGLSRMGHPRNGGKKG